MRLCLSLISWDSAWVSYPTACFLDWWTERERNRAVSNRKTCIQNIPKEFTAPSSQREYSFCLSKEGGGSVKGCHPSLRLLGAKPPFICLLSLFSIYILFCPIWFEGVDIRSFELSQLCVWFMCLSELINQRWKDCVSVSVNERERLGGGKEKVALRARKQYYTALNTVMTDKQHNKKEKKE